LATFFYSGEENITVCPPITTDKLTDLADIPKLSFPTLDAGAEFYNNIMLRVPTPKIEDWWNIAP